MQKIPDISWFRVLFISGIIILIISSALLWGQVLATPSERTGSDFMAFYAAGMIAREQGYSKVYDVALQQAVQEKVLGFTVQTQQVLIYIHLPFILPMLALITDNSYAASFVRWNFLMVVIFALAIWQVAKLYSPTWEIHEKQKFTIALSTFFPFIISLLLGQDTAVLVLGATLFVGGIWRKDDRLAGLGLAFATIRPHIAIFIAIPVLFRNRFIFGWFLFFTTLLAVFSMILMGPQGTLDFINILALSASGEGHGTNEIAMVNFIGMIQRIWHESYADIIRKVAWGLFLLSVFGLVFLWRNHKNNILQLSSLSIIAGLFFTPHLHMHDLSLLIIPLFITLQRNSPARANLGIVACSVFFLISYANPLLLYSFPYLLGCVLAWKTISRLQDNINLPQQKQTESLQ